MATPRLVTLPVDVIGQVSSVLTNSEQNAGLEGVHPMKPQEEQIFAVRHASLLHWCTPAIENGSFEPAEIEPIARAPND
jgi:hypothetical protein